MVDKFSKIIKILSEFLAMKIFEKIKELERVKEDTVYSKTVITSCAHALIRGTELSSPGVNNAAVAA